MKSKNELSEAAREARRRYYRKWYREHKEKAQAKQNKFWERQAAKGDDDDIVGSE